jgi:hypothetical protein
MSGKRVNWRKIADLLADRLETHAICPQHSVADAAPDCPWCQDRAAYRKYLMAGGHDYRPRPEGRGVPLSEIRPAEKITLPREGNQ